MLPVVVNPTVTFEQLVKEITTASDEKDVRAAIDELRAKLQRKKRALVGSAREEVELTAGMDLDAFFALLKSGTTDDLRGFFGRQTWLAPRLDRAALDRAAFQTDGGFARFNKVFDARAMPSSATLPTRSGRTRAEAPFPRVGEACRPWEVPREAVRFAREPVPDVLALGDDVGECVRASPDLVPRSRPLVRHVRTPGA
jgi:hypothetical protein